MNGIEYKIKSTVCPNNAIGEHGWQPSPPTELVLKKMVEDGLLKKCEARGAVWYELTRLGWNRLPEWF